MTEEPKRPMIQISHDGKIVSIDWDQIETAAEEFRIFMKHVAGMRMDVPVNQITVGQIAHLCVALREYMLKVKVLDLPEKAKR